ncbi:peptidoglycan-binding domain-containing protein [Streptomyces sp. RKAG290]|uniref:peptidoglycan-binding domain-containing protein n=1 Tax=Streptomyces sp. RKAG290 TaxID=2888348 RepID=UPI00203398B1|nr:peptidoglycan-binding domain-containing protein [Streptomyces sp. RKAG290]MCM2414385.1 peptidoglycan-binding protein [Streptomyces sp. RKAG290]
MTGHICPECGADCRPGTGPGCACAERAAHRGAGQPPATEQQHADERQRAAEQHRIVEEHHAGRSADFAAAEDFDPLRIRPYVTLGGEEAAAVHEESREHPPDGRTGDAATTMPLFLDPAGPGPDLPDATGPAGPGPAGPGPLPGATGPADPADPAGQPGITLAPGPDPVQPRRRKPFAALAAGAAVLAVVGTAAFIGGLFNGDDNGDADLDRALPSTVTSLPEESAAPSASRTASASASPSRPATASPSASGSASPSASASASRSPSASASGPAGPSSPAATAESSKPAQVAPPVESPSDTTLRRGDHGPEVAELQRRLQEVWLFRDPADADFTDRVEKAVRDFQSSMYIQGDPAGVYGPNTRRVLEAVTTGQGRH